MGGTGLAVRRHQPDQAASVSPPDHVYGPDPLKTASRRLRGMLAEPNPQPTRRELMRLLEMLEDHSAFPAQMSSFEASHLAERLDRLERLPIETVQLLHHLLASYEPRNPAVLQSLQEHLERLEQAMGGP